MIGLLLMLLLGLLVPGVVVAARYLDGQSWRKNLVGYRLRLPAGLTPDDVATWLSSVAALTHAPRGALLPPPPVVVEVRATRTGIEHRLLMPAAMTGAVLSSLRAGLPGVRLEPLTSLGTSAASTARFRLAAELQLVGKQRQLGVERAEAVSQSLLAALQPLQGDEVVCWQWILTSGGTPKPVPTPRKSSGAGLPSWLENQAPADADEMRAARLKQREPLLNVSGRLLVSSASQARTQSLFGRAWGGVRLLNVPGAQLVRSWWPSGFVERRFERRALPLLVWPLRLNSKELSGLLAFPIGEHFLPGVPVGLSRQVPPASTSSASGTVLADSTYPGMEAVLALSRRDRTMHVWLGGPTGVGKSTLMANMALQDMAAGDGLAVIDPKGDLITDLLERIPPNRRADVVVLDPSDVATSVGFNVLRVGGSAADQELAVDHVLHVLKEQWRAYWGPRTEAVLRATLLTLTTTTASNGQAFTLCEAAELLTNKQFRRFVVGQPTVPASVGGFWRWYDGISEAERTQVIGPVLNKLSAFTQRTPLRLMLGQSDGLDLARAMRERKILLVPLGRGQLGAETAGLIGSLLVAALWQTALGRTSVASQARRPWWLYIDEAQEVVRLPLEIADMLAEARGLQVGITLANQHLSQLPESVRHALLSTVRSQVVFQVEPADARVLARSFEPALTERDLRSLPAYEVAMRLCANGHTSRPVTGRTRPLPNAIGDGAQLRRASRDAYGVIRSQVEADLQARQMVSGGQRPFGARPSGASS